MKIVTITGKQKAECVAVADPAVADNYCLIRIQVAPMCTEVHDFRQGNLNNCLGHEAVGIVEKTGPKSRVTVGTRVAVMPQNGCGRCPLCLSGEHIHCTSPRDPLAVCGCTTGRATYAQFCIQQDWLLVPIPDDISMDHAAMSLCGLGPTFNACRLLRVTADDTVVVAGLGPVGLGAVINATHMNARVIGLDVNPYRLQLARDLGATDAIDPTVPGALDAVMNLTGGGADKAIETSNTAASPPFLVQALRRKGALAFVSWSGEVRVPDIVGKGLTIHGAWHWNHLTHTREMLQVIRANAVKLERFITHRFPMSAVQQAFEVQTTGQCGKVLLDPWG